MIFEMVPMGAGQRPEAKSILQQRLDEQRCLHAVRPFDPGITLPVGLGDAEVSGDLVTQIGALGATVILRGLEIGRGGGDQRYLCRRNQPALNGDSRQTDIGAPTIMARHYAFSGNKT
ncbi:hypothetical protein [Agrobacterium tumefaciens]|uniref:hypothetical protein n=1 Tax=Agrobacterium tumefaciens TaxID=358 RepID=UPI002A0FD403|nr:hypothetical protein [Agrobacterium tumefaciens]MDX8326118.1 hypothetical protein [Agrobacterium tumefaciens]